MLGALSAIVGTKVTFFSLVKSTIEELADGGRDSFYFCLTRHELIFLDRNLEVRHREGKGHGGFLVGVPYHEITRVIVDRSIHDLFILTLRSPQSFDAKCTRNGAKPTFPPEIVIKCALRDQLVSELAVNCRTAFLYKNGTLPSKQLVVYGDIDWADAHEDGKVGEFVLPPDSGKRHSVNGYFFFLPGDFVQHGPMDYGQRHAVYVSAPTGMQDADRNRNASMEFQCYKPHTVGVHSPSGVMSVKQLAENCMRERVSQVKDYRIIGPGRRYQKKMNLTGDPACWDCWAIHFRTFEPASDRDPASLLISFRDIAIMAVERRYIPPVMENAQRILLVHYGPRNSFTDRSDDFLRSIESITDSVSPEINSFDFDRLMVQTKADALLLDATAYSWFATSLRVHPRAVRNAKLFCKSLLIMLQNANLKFSAKSVFPELRLGDEQDDPFEYAVRMEDDHYGIFGEGDESLIIEWKRRVWGYLAYCVDGGLLPGVLSIDDLVYQYLVLSHDKVARSKLAQVLETLLYFESRGRAYENIPLLQKVADERTVSNFSFNREVFTKLLDAGYFGTVLGAMGESTEYPRFLMRMIRSCNLSGKGQLEAGESKVLYAILKKMVKTSMGFMDNNQSDGVIFDENAVSIIIPAIVDVLNVNDENLKVLAIVSLVNFTRSNPPIKSLVASGGALRSVIRFLSSRHQDLLRHSCSLLSNCTKKSEQYRQSVASYGAIPLLLNLAERSRYPPYYYSSPVLIQAIAVLGNLAMEERLRQKITDALGMEVEMDKRYKVRFEQPKAIRIIVDLLDAEGMQSSDSLMAAVIFTLKNLAIKHNENKRTIGRLGIPSIVQIVKSSNNGILVDVALRCCYILSFNRNNCHILHRERLQEVFENPSHMQEHMDIIRQIMMKFKAHTG